MLMLVVGREESYMGNRMYDNVKKGLQIVLVMLFVGMLVSAGGKGNKVADNNNTIQSGQLRKVVYALVSSAENSTLDYQDQYAYIEDIGDGRGYTAGIIGFTTGTGDLIEVVEEYAALKQDNVLEKYLPALEEVIGTDSHDGLGEAFEADWRRACEDSEMITAQDKIVDTMYLSPAVEYASEDGLSVLGQYIYYDALVVHGPGEDEDSFNGIRKSAMKECSTPANGGSEEQYLLAFLDARTLIMLKEEAHSDLSRIEAQRKFIQEGNFELKLPITWTMYGDSFELSEENIP